MRHLLLLTLAAAAACDSRPIDDPPGERSSALCSQGQPCTTSNGCKLGHVDCASGSSACTGLIDQPEGTACAGGRTCQAGACTACGAGLECYEASGCRKGSVDCASGFPVCSALADELDGKACAAGACHSGACLPVPAADAGLASEDAGAQPPDGPEMVRSGCRSGNVPAALLGAALLVALPARRRRG